MKNCTCGRGPEIGGHSDGCPYDDRPMFYIADGWSLEEWRSLEREGGAE